ncbi:c-type cytochrome biogenesis protein CcmI [Usitatibacter palustris]|uniref:Uncharacterized protein n=1 Tax=Usitatibacter palustris TaxID=2732487 RepID=A0A6M4H760_9PROT|nr:c-type cytochrome biogenesis protein CcmI [Usitatibacter palustris]QJR15015.1 hypothetical protein DSM104440_01831 [Usitatibacter palustris]
MILFSILAVLMTGVALAFVLVPLLRSRNSAAPTSGAANLRVLRDARREIDADVASGVLPAESREEALAELVARAESDLAAREADAPPPARRPWIVVGIMAFVVPAIAVGLYLALGTPEAINPAQVQAKGPSDRQIEEMVENLARKVRERPDDAPGWALLARSMNALGRYPEAIEAYAHLAKLMPNDANVLADYADSLAMAQGRNLSGKPYELVRQALKIDPLHQKALALAGTAALNENDFAGAVRYWETLARSLPPGSEDAPKVFAIIGEVRERATAAGKPLPPQGAALPPPAAPAAAPAPAAPIAKGASPVTATGSVSGNVTLDPKLASQVGPGDTLFIYARAEGGPRMPLAILRVSAKELPRAFELTDAMAMAPGMNLSSAPAVRIEARISKSGGAVPQPGDLSGTSAVVKPGTRGVKIVIDKVLP